MESKEGDVKHILKFEECGLWCPQAIQDVCGQKTWKINDDKLSLKSSVV